MLSLLNICHLHSIDFTHLFEHVVYVSIYVCSYVYVSEGEGEGEGEGERDWFISGEHWVSPSVTIHILVLRQALSVSLELSKRAGQWAPGLLHLCLPSTGDYSCVLLYHLAFYTATSDLNSGQYACASKHFINWDVYSTSLFILWASMILDRKLRRGIKA